MVGPLPAWPVQTNAPASGRRLSPRWFPTPELIRQLPRLLELATVPGAAIAVVDTGRTWDHGFGRASLDPPQQVTTDTVFEAASLGKPLFAYQVLRMVDAGLLDLDRPLYDYLPVPEANNKRMRRVTTRHVLSHTSGLPNWRKEPGPLEPATEPGTAYAYSGEGFFYLQRVVEKVTGRPVARLMEEEIFGPFGMTDSSYVWRPAFDRRMAVGYDETGNRQEVYAAIGRRAAVVAAAWKRPLLDWRYEESARTVTLVNPEWPVLPLYMVPNVASSLLTTARDYARFLTRVVAPQPDGLTLQRATLEQMTRPQIEINSALSWGLGWGIQRDEFGQVLWHWGANNSFRNFVIADIAGGRAVVVLTNGENGPRVYERVIASVTGHDHPAFLRA
ncbi:MAG TPA: serine hydrolase domain-containing protein [Gemmatimonadales bacterium]